ncbi:MAG: ATP-binding protein [Cyclobacteriaceae bacterium]
MGILSSIVNRKRVNETDSYNRVFRRQIRKIFGDNPVIPPDFEELFEKVNETYHDFEKDRTFLQNTTDISIKELRHLNDDLQQNKQDLSSTQDKLEESKKLSAMSEELQQSNTELQAKQKEIAAAYDELKDAQSQLVLSEKMASLGQLTAGVAHEINTPLSVINGSITNLNDSLISVVNDMPAFFKTLPADHEALFMEMVKISAENTKGETRSTKEEREVRKTVTELLESKNVPDARGIARSIVRVGLQDDIDKFIPIFESGESDGTVEMVLRMGKLQSNVNNMSIAVSKMQKIVYSLKNYSHFQTDEIAEEINIIDGIENVLVLYQNKMKLGVELTRNYESEKVTVVCLQDQLDQVWTNIIHNAVQAMDYQGSLTIGAGYEGENTVVTIQDSGPGIPESALKKIFDPFYTTKSQGEGSGLGLPICKKIIDKHGGALEVDSVPGKTVFKISLPTKGEKISLENDKDEN